jgi:hypothetical protein
MLLKNGDWPRPNRSGPRVVDSAGCPRPGRDLAELCGVPLKRLNEQVKRNQDRFPDDFMFQLTLEEGKEGRAS